MIEPTTEQRIYRRWRLLISQFGMVTSGGPERGGGQPKNQVPFLLFLIVIMLLLLILARQ